MAEKCLWFDIARVYGFAIKRKSFLIEMLQRESFCMSEVGISHWDGQVLPQFFIFTNLRENLNKV